MSITFEKLHGLGNDFVFIDGMNGSIELTEDQVRFLCDRHFGIGGDGVIVVRPSERAECAGYMHYINSDGTLAQMCGNGVRCTAKFLVDHGYADAASGSVIVDTLSGPKPITFETDDDGKLTMATVDMGEPILKPSLVPTALEGNFTYEGVEVAREVDIAAPWGTFAFTCVSMGNPHAVCFIDDFNALDDSCFVSVESKTLDTLNVDAIGAYFESHSAFPEKANIEFATCEGDGLAMRVFERGCGETMACGTGTCATSVAAALTGRRGRRNAVRLLGGTLIIDWRENGHVLMTGPAELSFTGNVEL